MSVATLAIEALIASRVAWEPTGDPDDYDYCRGKESGLNDALEAVTAAEARYAAFIQESRQVYDESPSRWHS